MKSYKHIPLYTYVDFDDFNTHRPYDCPLIGVEIDNNATPLADYNHRQKCIYLLGAEDHGLTNEAYKHCQEIIALPGARSLNVAVTGSIVLYARHTK